MDTQSKKRYTRPVGKAVESVKQETCMFTSGYGQCLCWQECWTGQPDKQAYASCGKHRTRHMQAKLGRNNLVGFDTHERRLACCDLKAFDTAQPDGKAAYLD